MRCGVCTIVTELLNIILTSCFIELNGTDILIFFYRLRRMEHNGGKHCIVRNIITTIK
jgi:hypothetical protein